MFVPEKFSDAVRRFVRLWPEPARLLEAARDFASEHVEQNGRGWSAARRAGQLHDALCVNPRTEDAGPTGLRPVHAHFID